MVAQHATLASIISAVASAMTFPILTGCADTMMSDTKVRDSVAMSLGQPAASVRIRDRQYDGMTNTFVTANTPRGTYRCIINGGGVLAMGIINLPSCTRL